VGCTRERESCTDESVFLSEERERKRAIYNCLKRWGVGHLTAEHLLSDTIMPQLKQPKSSNKEG
jgi:hypothetical protein